jgi:hypothetical protein
VPVSSAASSGRGDRGTQLSKPSSQLSIGFHSLHDPQGGWRATGLAPIQRA